MTTQPTLLLAGNNSIAKAELIEAKLERPWKILKWHPDTDERADLMKMLPEADVLVGGDVLGDWPQGLKMGMYQIPFTGCDWATEPQLPAGCRFCNTFEHETAMAEYIMLQMLEWELDMSRGDRAFREKGWKVGWPTSGGHGEIRGKTIGILGHGHIGREVALRCAPFGARVIGVSRTPKATPPELEWLGVCDGPDAKDLHRLYEQSDYIVVCCVLSEQTRGIVNADGFARMRDRAVIINVARGPVIDELALYNALKDETIRGASIDVWYNYPSHGKAMPEPSQYPMFDLDNIRVSPHNSGSTSETNERRWISVVDNLNRFARGDELRNVVMMGDGSGLK